MDRDDAIAIDLWSPENRGVKLVKQFVCLMARPWFLQIERKQYAGRQLIFNYLFWIPLWVFSALDAIVKLARVAVMDFRLKARLKGVIGLKIPIGSAVLIISVICDFPGQD